VAIALNTRTVSGLAMVSFTGATMKPGKLLRRAFTLRLAAEESLLSTLATQKTVFAPAEK